MPGPRDREVVGAVVRWLQIRGIERPDYTAPWLTALVDDAKHSALLQRLLDGGQPFVDKPPLRDGQPDYIGFTGPCGTCGHPRTIHEGGAGACEDGKSNIYGTRCRCQHYRKAA